MQQTSGGMPFGLSGRWQYRLRSVLALYRALIAVSARRLIRGPRRDNWTWGLEVSLDFMRAQAREAFAMPDMVRAREYEDALVFASPAAARVRAEPVEGPPRGCWVHPPSPEPDRAVLYLHGGGFAYYSTAHHNLIALAALAARARTFALDYRLAPEHAYPAQLEDALAAYRWLLETGCKPERLVVIGDSAGGNLVLTLLLALREAGLPLPALGVCLAPWTDLANSGASMRANEATDWIDRRMAERWSRDYRRAANAADPLVSPLCADLRGLPPLYLQAGGGEILLDMIRAFAERASRQGARVQLEVWPNMPHDFQAFGDLQAESQAALRRIAEVIEKAL
jgi:acetyl esterase/lipase